jgi:DUF1009 family protein
MSAGPVSSVQSPLAMLCGGGTLPVAVAESVSGRGRPVVMFMLRGAAAASGAIERFPHHWLHIGQIGKFLRLARAAGCRDVVFIGSLVRPSIWRAHPDLTGLCMLPRVLAAYRGGDDHLLRGMSRLLEQEGLRLVGAHEVAPEILMPCGPLGSIEPTARDRDDIALGFDYLRAAGPFDVGQAAVVANKHVLAVEAAEGTDQMLARVAQLRAAGRIASPSGVGVLVKAPKPAQDRRFDLPSIGPQTVEEVKRAGLAGIAVTAGATVIAEPEKLVAAADGAAIFIAGIAAGNAK